MCSVPILPRCILPNLRQAPAIGRGQAAFRTEGRTSCDHVSRFRTVDKASTPRPFQAAQTSWRFSQAHSPHPPTPLTIDKGGHLLAPSRRRPIVQQAPQAKLELSCNVHSTENRLISTSKSFEPATLPPTIYPQNRATCWQTDCLACCYDVNRRIRYSIRLLPVALVSPRS